MLLEAEELLTSIRSMKILVREDAGEELPRLRIRPEHLLVDDE
jgi:hypothetical protein